MTHAPAADTYERAVATSPRKLAMWLFLASEVVFFGGLIGAYLMVRTRSPELWPGTHVSLNIPLTATMTFILICSSVTMVLSYDAALRGRQRAARLFLLGTILLGSLFVGLQGFEWTKLLQEGLHPSNSLLGESFFTLTGFHGGHVTGGLVALLYVYLRLAGGHYRDEPEGIEMVGLYWHFVDVVWIFLFAILYLI